MCAGKITFECIRPFLAETRKTQIEFVRLVGRFFFDSLVMVTLVSLTITLSGCSSKRERPFVVYDALLFVGKPDLASYGFKKNHIIYTWYLWPPGTDLNNPPNPLPNEEYARTQARQAIGRSDDNLVQLDIEHWETDSRIPGVNVMESISFLRQELGWVKNEAPKLKVGYYALVPIADYWNATSSDPAKVAAWKAANDRLQPLIDDVDALFPSIYTFYPNDVEGWVMFAEANIEEAKRLARGKPVYPFIWPQYHPSEPVGGQYVSYEYWKRQLETVKNAGVDGVIIWGGYQTPWDENQGWWRATKEFMATLK